MTEIQTITISKRKANYIDNLLLHEPTCESECFGEGETISYTARFSDGIEIDVKICGVKFKEGESNLPWVEGVLFHNGSEVECTEPDVDIWDKWNFEYEGKEYVLIITKEGE